MFVVRGVDKSALHQRSYWTFRLECENFLISLAFYSNYRRINMNATRFTRRSLLALFLSVTITGAYARAQQYEPHVGQEGKDVIWVPTPQALVDKMLDMAKVNARALGIEYNPDMVELSKRNAAKAGVTDKANFVKADLFESDFSQATVITMFLLPDINLRLRPKILDLKPGIRIVSNSFTMGDWKADDTVTVTDDCASYCTAYLWIVPAKVEGKWQLPQGELTLNQTYQMISGTLKNGSNVIQIANGKLNGNEVTFNAGGSLYTGRVNGNAMEGNISSGGNWKA